jgi:hypothetical protein
MRFRPNLTVLAIATVLSGAISAAHAQSPAQSAGGTGGALDKVGPVVGGKPSQRAAKAPAPPALPGAALGQDRVTPAEKGQADLPPTEALFDAVNRGDINSARDALNRGADISSRNVLGMTPLDQSIDLSRNDITFLLLSLRQAGRAEGPAPAKPAAKATPQARQPSPAAVAAVVAPAPRPLPPKPAPALAVQAPAPRQQAQSRQPDPIGTANPQAGFLGFGG